MEPLTETIVIDNYFLLAVCKQTIKSTKRLFKALEKILEKAGYSGYRVAEGFVWDISYLYYVNEFPFKVEKNGSEDIFMTGFIDDIIRKIRFMIRTEMRKCLEVKNIIEKDIRNIRSTFQPIFLSESDVLVEFPLEPNDSLAFPYLISRISDETPLPEFVGNHKSCGGLLKIIRLTPNEPVIQCIRSSCMKTFPFSADVGTYGELRDYFLKNQEAAIV